MWAAVLAASAAILGSVTGGLFNLAIQRGSWTADNSRWLRDAEQRRRDRLYDQRLQVYTNFLNESSNALGFESNKVLARYRQEKTSANAPLMASSPHIEILASLDSPAVAEFNETALMRMSRVRRTIDMLTESEQVRNSAEGMWMLVLEMVSLRSDDPDINGKFFAIYREHGEVTDKFVLSVHAELTS